LIEEAARTAGAVPTDALLRHVDETVRVAGWVVTDRRVRVRGPRLDAAKPGAFHAGRYMKFLMLEDARGTVEVTVFPRAYARVGHRLVGAGPFLVTGRVRADHGALTLDAREVVRLEA
jgi:DNA polymerase III alpha subunit